MHLFKKAASICLAVVLTLSMLAVPEKAFAADVYEIYNEADWNEFADAVNFGDDSASAIVMADFTATEDFQQVYEMYTGTFDGNGKVISGLTTSLFDYVCGGTVKDVIVADVNITDYVGYESMSIIVDALYGGTVSGCKVLSGSINVSGDKVAGIVGLAADGEIINCSNNADVTGDNKVGGIVGDVWPDTSVSIINCYNTGNISAASYAGGIAGEIVAWSTDIEMTNVYNTGDVYAVEISGGIAGIITTMTSSDRISLSNAYNSGVITSDESAGSIYGRVETSSPSTIPVNNAAYITNGTALSVGSVNTGSGSAIIQTKDYYPGTAYDESALLSGELAYILNNGASDSAKWSFDGEKMVFADENNKPTEKVIYSVDGVSNEAYVSGAVIGDVVAEPEYEEGKLFAGWFTEDLGVIETVDASVVAAAADLNAELTDGTEIYSAYIPVGTLTKDAADTITTIEDNDSGFYLEGAQYRKADAANGVSAGVRFITRISTELIANVEALNPGNESLKPQTAADKGIGYGTVLTAVSNIADGQMLEKDLAAASVMKGMIVSPAIIDYKKYEGYTLYTALVVGIPTSHYNTNIAGRPYITYYDVNGVERTYYYVETGSSHVAGGGYYTSYQTLVDFYG